MNALFYFLALLIAFGLKHHYSKAGSDALIWILAPTATLVEQISGMPFEYETGTGFVNPVHRIIIAPSCAGVNFLIIAFCMAAFCGLHLLERNRHKLLWMALSGMNAFALTLAVNTLRIILSIHIYQIDISGDWIAPDRIHRLAGVVIYFFFLCLFYMIMNKGLHRWRLKFSPKPSGGLGPVWGRPDYLRWRSITLKPLFWYALITLGVPLMNAAHIGNGARFAEHVGAVAGGCIIVTAAVFLLQWLWRRVKKYIKRFA